MKFSLSKKVFFLVLLMAVVIALGTIAVSYGIYANTMDTHYRTLAQNLASTAAQVLDKQEVQTLTDQVMTAYRQADVDYDAIPADGQAAYFARFTPAMESEAYASLSQRLSVLKKENDVLWMYICYMDAQTGKAVYIIDVDDSGDANLPGTCDPIEAGNLALMQQGVYDFPAYVTNYAEYGWLVSASAAITSEDGGVIANAYVDISMNEVMADRQQFLLRLAIIVLVLTAILTAAILFLVNAGVVRPINRLASAADSFITDKHAGQEDSAISRLTIHTGDEIENLSHSIQRMEQEINAYITDLTRVTGERERIGAELNVATNIQASMLPCIFPAFPQRQEFDIYATMAPAKEVGGDFYDFFLVDDDHLAMVMADVSGKGVPAAMFMVIAKTLLKNSAQTGLSPSAVLTKVNDQLCENNDAEMFVTVWLGVLEISTGRMVCANAGHEYPAIRRKDGPFEMFKDRHGFVLAAMPGAKYRDYEVQLNPGDMLFVYTDGVPEATNAAQELYGTDRMLRALNSPFASCEELLQNLRQDLDGFVGDAPQFDDITMLALELRQTSAPAMHTTTLAPVMKNQPAAVSFFQDLLEAADAPAKLTAQVSIVVDEIFANIATYSGASLVTLGCTIENNTVTLRFEDDGRPYDPTAKDDPDTAAALEDREIGGLGIFIVKKIMDDVAYGYDKAKNVLTLTKTW